MSFISVLKDIGNVIAWPFIHVARVISILTITLKDYPAVRTAIVGEVNQIQTLIQDADVAAGSDELNLQSDEAELNAAIALWNYSKNTFLPAIEAAYNAEVAAATEQAQAAATAPPRVSTAARKAAATRMKANTTSTTAANGDSVSTPAGSVPAAPAATA